MSARILFSVSHFVTTLVLISFATYVYLSHTYPNLLDIKYFGWIPIVSMIITVAMRSIGIMPILDMLGNELYPTGMDKCRGHTKFCKAQELYFHMDYATNPKLWYDAPFPGQR